MTDREQDLQMLQNYLARLDKEATLILQTLQWDRKHLTEKQNYVTCSIDSNHRMPPERISEHEEVCYSKTKEMLSGPRNMCNAVKSRNDNNGASDQLQPTNTGEKTRSIFGGLSTAPAQGNIADLTLQSGEGVKSVREKSELEILAELRDMKRRRTKYRVAAKTRNYSDVLRDVITSQMELYAEVRKGNYQENLETSHAEKQPGDDANDTTHTQPGRSNLERYNTDRDKHSVKLKNEGKKHDYRHESYKSEHDTRNYSSRYYRSESASSKDVVKKEKFYPSDAAKRDTVHNHEIYNRSDKYHRKDTKYESRSNSSRLYKEEPLYPVASNNKYAGERRKKYEDLHDRRYDRKDYKERDSFDYYNTNRPDDKKEYEKRRRKYTESRSHN